MKGCELGITINIQKNKQTKDLPELTAGHILKKTINKQICTIMSVLPCTCAAIMPRYLQCPGLSFLYLASHAKGN